LLTLSNTAFGANNQQPSLFGGAKPNAFGQSTTTSGSTLFGNTAATTSAPSAFGGFGATSANTGAFGTGGTQSSTLFGQNNQAKPGGFGVGNPSLFGAGGFGTTNSTTNAFGAPTSTALGPNIPPSDGTAKIPFQAKTEKENNATVHYQNIACQEPYQNYSQEVSPYPVRHIVF
jgi:nuclear pore complex protein Nup98-Nup96